MLDGTEALARLHGPVDITPGACPEPGKRQLFHPGETVLTNDACAAIRDAGDDPAELVRRHTEGDWGCVSLREAAENEYGLLFGRQIVSFYRLRNGHSVGVITDGTRQSTTLVAPATAGRGAL